MEKSQQRNTRKSLEKPMNKVTLEPRFNKVELQSYENKVDVEVIRVHTDYHFMTYSQTIPEHKEV